MNKTKILFLLHLPPPVHGSSMVGKWIKDSEQINTTFSTSYINLLASSNIKETGKLSVAKVLSTLKIIFTLIQRLIIVKPNKIYFALTTTGFAFYRDVLLVFIIKLFGCKIVYHLHNKGVQRASERKINNCFYNYVFRNSQVILLSEHLYSDISKFVTKPQIFICPNGIPEVDIKDILIKNHESKTVQILFLSNLIESKGVLVLLEALKTLNEENINFEAIYVGGEGDISSGLLNRKIVEYNLTNKVKYLGKKYGNDKNKIFQQSDIFVFPTSYSNECFPLVLLEAMQFKLPLISCPEGGIPDIVQNNYNGFLVPKQNSRVLAEAIKKLIDDPELRKVMGENSFREYCKKFTLETFEQNLCVILKQ